MRSILEQFYAGELYPIDRPVPQTEEYQDSFHAFCTGRNQLLSQLQETDPNMAQRLSDLLDEQGIMYALEREDMFYYGLSLGMRLLAEALYFT